MCAGVAGVDGKLLLMLTTTNSVHGKALPISNLPARFVVGAEIACQAKACNRQAKGVFR